MEQAGWGSRRIGAEDRAETMSQSRQRFHLSVSQSVNCCLLVINYNQRMVNARQKCGLC